MSINIEITSILTRYTDKQMLVQVQGSTVGECLQELVKRFPKLKQIIFDKNDKLYDTFHIFINGESAYPDEMVKPVKDGDKLNIVWVIQGG